MACYFAEINYTTSRSFSPYPTLKILKDWIKDGLKEYQEHQTGIESLAAIGFVKLSSGPEHYGSAEDVTKWFFESYYSSHANKAQKQWIENNIFKTTTKDKLKAFLTEDNIITIRDQAIQDQKDYLKIDQ